MAILSTTAEIIEIWRHLYKPVGLLLLGLVLLQTNIVPRWRHPLVASIFYFSIPILQPTYAYNTLPGYVLGFSTVWLIMLSIAFLIPDQDRHRISIRLSKDKGRPVYDIQPYKDTPIESAIPRALALLVNLRGIGWNHSAPNFYRGKNGDLNDPEVLITGNESYVARAQEMRSKLLQRCLYMSVVDYLVVDFVLYLALRDDFLSGDLVSNPFLLPWSDCIAWLILMPYRVLVGGVGICTAMDLASRIFRLVSVGMLGKQFWDYPPLYGSVLSIWDRGLAGFWGVFWHQCFRYGFTSVAMLIVPEDKSASSEPSMTIRNFLRLAAVFALSGAIHAGGSWTLAASMPTPLLACTHPVLTFFAFFLQAPGIAIQMYLFPHYRPEFGNETVYKLKMFGFTCVWMFLTMPLLMADLAGGQFFKLPFVPYSITEMGVKSCGILLSSRSFLAGVVLP